MLIVAPELYHWHHDHDAGDYANLSPLMDNLFGTCRSPSVEPEAFGIKEPIPGSYLSQRWYPFKWSWPASSGR
jgi:sterol desaturase/sphingolipid hydroxylase (fatty acid hydroxylase superfamily)